MLSIIIPIYNAEKYISECVESVLNQSYKNIELLLIDNMSTDSSKSICQGYVNIDKRVKIFSEFNKGAAAARNRGIKEASGDYITFVDSDDYIAINTYEIIINKMDEMKVDLACFSFNCVDENRNSLNWYEPRLNRFSYKKKKYTGIETAKIFLTSLDIEGFCWNKVFKRELFNHNNIYFEENKTAYEDMAIIFDIICKCETVVLIPDKFYYYRQVSASLTHKQYNNKAEEYYDSIEHIINTANQYGLRLESYIFWISRSIWQKYDSCKSKFKNKNQKNENIELIDFIRQEASLMFYLKSDKIRTVLKGIVLRYNNEYNITRIPIKTCKRDCCSKHGYR